MKNKELEMETKIIKSEEKLRQLKEIVYKVSLPEQNVLQTLHRAFFIEGGNRGKGQQRTGNG